MFVGFVCLLQVSMLPFGGHFVKNCLSSLEVYMIEDKRLAMTGRSCALTSFPRPLFHCRKVGIGTIVSITTNSNYDGGVTQVWE